MLAIAAASVCGECRVLGQTVYRVDRSSSWNSSHSPTLPRVRRVPSGPGGKFLDHPLNSPIGIAAGPLLNSKWVEAYSRVGFDVLTYKTVRSMAMPAHALPNIRPVENREHAAIATRKTQIDSQPTLAVSLGMPSAEPEVWRKDVRRAKDRIGSGQVLIVSVVGTWAPGMDAEQLVQDYARCAAWAAEAGGDAIEVHLAVPDPFAEQPQLIYENIPLAAQILYRVRTTMPKPVLAKLGVFRTPRVLHETGTKLASWASGFVMTHGVRRRVVDEEGNAAFEGAGRDGATKGSFSLEFRELSVVLTALTRPPQLPHHGGRARPSTSKLLAMIPSPTQRSIPASPRYRQRRRP